MTGQIPTIGRVVHYTLNDADATLINDKRADPVYKAIHQGNTAVAGQTFSAEVVRKFADSGTSVNLQVKLDGTDTYWATSRQEGDGHGQWTWPPRVLPGVPAEVTSNPMVTMTGAKMANEPGA